MDQDQKDQLEKDAKLLQRDLKKRPKKVVRRGVEIKMGTGKKKKTNLSSPSPHPPLSDDFLRKQLGL